jgi:HK97 family phage major capsid protein
MRDPNSAEGRSAAKQVAAANQAAPNRQAIQTEIDRARVFTNDVETRSLSTGGSSGGSFVTPNYFVQDYAPYRQFGRVFADAAHREPLPEYGVTLYLPAVNQAASVFGTTAENIGVAEQDPTAAYLSVNLTTNSGQVVVSQQLLDRAGPNFAYDTMVFDQLHRAYNLTLDTYCLTNAINTASVSAASVASPTGSSQAQPIVLGIAGAKAQMADTAGTVLRATHTFWNVALWEYLTAQNDSNGRPLFNSEANGPFANWAAAAGIGAPNPAAEGDTGFRVLGLPVYEDNNIPTVSSAYQVLVCDMDQVWFWEGELVNRAIPQTYANNLQVLLQVYAYVGLINRYPQAVQSVNGTSTKTATITF